MSIKLYEVDHEYIDYLAPFAPHLFHNKKQEQQNERKYIGVILVVDDMKYFADDAECVIDYQIWFEKRTAWVEEQELHTRTNELFTELVATTAQIPIDPSLAEACDKGKIEEYKTDYLDQMIEKI